MMLTIIVVIACVLCGLTGLAIGNVYGRTTGRMQAMIEMKALERELRRPPDAPDYAAKADRSLDRKS